MVQTLPSHLFTFGYEGLDIASFVARAQAAGVQTIVDVRELPLSRKKGFSKASFRSVLADAGIGYVHVPALGCPKPIRDRYRADGDWHAYTEAFLAHLETQEVAVRGLAALAGTTASCLVCFEADHTRCHRTYVARAAREVGAPAVMHLTSSTALPDEGPPKVASAAHSR